MNRFIQDHPSFLIITTVRNGRGGMGGGGGASESSKHANLTHRY